MEDAKVDVEMPRTTVDGGPGNLRDELFNSLRAIFTENLQTSEDFPTGALRQLTDLMNADDLTAARILEVLGSSREVSGGVENE